MSTILDALKKSEQERKLNQVPTLSTMPAPSEASRWPIYTIIILLILLIALLAYWFWRYQSPVSLEQNTVAESSKKVTEELKKVEDFVVNVVSYSDQVERRFAMIDGAVYYEGDFLQAGVKVERITKDTVVLNQRGKLVVIKP